MRILVTNDDGIHSEGIAMLAAALIGAGHDVLVVAPDTDQSGMGAALGPLEPGEHIGVTRFAIAGTEGFAVHAPPALGVFAASQGAFDRVPELVVSGVNAGLNTGHAVLHSGTVGAAFAAAAQGIDAMAVSVDVSDPWRYDTATTVALQTLAWLLENPIAGAVLNVNVPALDLDDLHGFRWAALDEFGSVQTAGHDPRKGLVFELRSDGAPPSPESDRALVKAGFVTATVVCPVTVADHEHLPPIMPRHVVAAHRQTAQTRVSSDVIALDREDAFLG